MLPVTVKRIDAELGDRATSGQLGDRATSGQLGDRATMGQELPLPSYARLNDAGLDLLAAEAVEVPPAGGRATVPTGIAVGIPPGYAGFVQPRSGLAAKHGVTVLNSPGLIDAGYRGEIKIILVNTDPAVSFKIERGDRIAQLVVQKVEHVRFEEVDELPTDEEAEGGAPVRGAGGFGHSGL